VAKATKGKAVVVTTAHRGVFFGYLENEEDGTTKTVVLADAQMCVYWTTEVQGVLGLAVSGPLKGSRVGPAVPRIVLQDVTAVIKATKEAEARWLERPWS
jgi:hypothetical protein